jgi:hypothetical protein
MRHGQLTVNGTVVPSPNSFVLSDSVADEPQAIFDWQHRIEIRGSRFGPPVAAPSLHQWGPLVIPSGTFFMIGDTETIPLIAATTEWFRAQISEARRCSSTTRTTRRAALTTFVL